eukprot:Em0016g1082a
MAASSMVVDETDILHAVRDFLEHSGRAECMRALEKSAGICPQDLSEVMQFLRELTLDGRWKEVRDFIEVLADTEHKQAYNECRYEVIKQQYLEAVQGVPLEQALQQLEELKTMKPTDEVYSKLEQLLPVSFASRHKNDTESEIYSSRLRCFQVLLPFVLRVLYPGQTEATPTPCETPLSQDRLCLLLLKGRLYEECENKCRERGGRGLPAGILHLASWIERLADKAFSQELFTAMSMTVNPHAPATNTCMPEPVDRAVRVCYTTESASKNEVRGSTPSVPPSKDRSLSPHAQDSSEGVVISDTPKVMPAHSTVLRFENDFVQTAPTSAPAMTTPTSAPAMTTPTSAPVMTTPTSAPLLVDKHMSSTPKHPISSAPPPTSSPVPYVLGTHGLHDTPHLSHHITSKSAVTEWPLLSPRGTVTDTQVVRAVAFSHSGELVAIGSNSRTLKVLSTEPLLSSTCLGEMGESLATLKAHHKGSIYCLAWFQDRIVASGSNDQTIKLLDFGTNTLQGAKRLAVHNGTVRDLNFLKDGAFIPSWDTLKRYWPCAPWRPPLWLQGGADRTVRLWDTRQHSQAGILRLPSGVGALSFHQTQLAVATLAGECLVYDHRTMKLLATAKPHTDECRSVSYSADGRWLLTGSYDGQVSLVCSRSMEWKAVCRESDKVIQCRWHSSSELFAVTSAQRRASFWALQ